MAPWRKACKGMRAGMAPPGIEVERCHHGRMKWRGFPAEGPIRGSGARCGREARAC